MVRVDFNHVIRISLSVDISVPDAYLRAEKDCLKGNEDLSASPMTRRANGERWRFVGGRVTHRRARQPAPVSHQP